MKAGLVWIVFGAVLAVAVAALGWSTTVVLDLERNQKEAQAQAALEENTRLALWRMDSALTALIARESARPYFQYSAFYPTGGAYGRIVTEASPFETFVASPLLRETPPRVLLHFQVAPDGTVSSPQVPMGVWRVRAAAEPRVAPANVARHTETLRELRTAASALAAPVTVAEAPKDTRSDTRGRSLTAAVRRKIEELPYQQQRSAREFERRQEAVQQSNTIQSLEPAPAAPQLRLPAEPGDVDEGALTPRWVADRLVLARRVRVNGATYVQGCWLDWPHLQQDLLASVRDLLPEARLERASDAPDVLPGDDERRLAALPVRLLPGRVPPPYESFSPVRLSLIGAWGGLALAALSVALLLAGVLALSERRRVFVSAVTHELRTPLTTFRLYTDMLAEGMVPSPEKRAEYVRRLQSEAQRLGHLVENVLFYARLEGGRAAGREAVDLGPMLEATLAPLRPRAAAAGLELLLETQATGPVRVHADRSALEQIVVNLVDNACKYATGSRPSTVHVTLGISSGRAVVTVRDHGPGLSPSDRRRLFRPFSKSDREAAASAPGVGLGLALSRRLARAQGGELRLVERGGAAGGAAFELALPLAPSP